MFCGRENVQDRFTLRSYAVESTLIWLVVPTNCNVLVVGTDDELRELRVACILPKADSTESEAVMDTAVAVESPVSNEDLVRASV
jgi:hypothetical protein